MASTGQARHGERNRAFCLAIQPSLKPGQHEAPQASEHPGKYEERDCQKNERINGLVHLLNNDDERKAAMPCETAEARGTDRKRNRDTQEEQSEKDQYGDDDHGEAFLSGFSNSKRKA